MYIIATDTTFRAVLFVRHRCSIEEREPDSQTVDQVIAQPRVNAQNQCIRSSCVRINDNHVTKACVLRFTLSICFGRKPTSHWAVSKQYLVFCIKMAEIVEYRVQRTIDELNLLIEFKLLSSNQVKDIIAKREKFEYTLRRRNRTKLDFLKYIQFELNLLESIDKYRKSVIADYYKAKRNKDASDEEKRLEEIDRRILLLKSKKLAEIVRSRSIHISSLFRKLTTSFQFDKKLWSAYIEFAKSRKWNSRASALYWRLLRVASDDPKIWIDAADHEIETSHAYESARGLYLRALRHHPESWLVWSNYLKMELDYMNVIGQRARIVFKKIDHNNESANEADWAQEEKGLNDVVETDDECDVDNADDKRPQPIIPIDDNDAIVSGQLPKLVFDNASEKLQSDNFHRFTVVVLHELYNRSEDLAVYDGIISHIYSSLESRLTNDEFIQLKSQGYVNERYNEIMNEPARPVKKLKPDDNESRNSLINRLYDCYESKNIGDTRALFKQLEKSVKNQKLCLYVGMIQVENWEYDKTKASNHIEHIRSLYERALQKFGGCKPKLWCEYMKFEYDNQRDLDSLGRISSIYNRAQSTLSPALADRVVEKFTMLKQCKSSRDMEYSDYSDIDD